MGARSHNSDPQPSVDWRFDTLNERWSVGAGIEQVKVGVDVACVASDARTMFLVVNELGTVKTACSFAVN